MATWNQTKYVFIGSKEEIGKLNEIIENMLSGKTLKSGDFENNWLGFIVKAINENPNEVNCRGYIENPKLVNETTLKFTTWTVGSSCFQLFELICQKFPTLEYYFISTDLPVFADSYSASSIFIMTTPSSAGEIHFVPFRQQSTK